MFGSTIEYMLRNFTKNFDSIDGYITADGSMHSYKKEFHPRNLNALSEYNDNIKISTPIYPFSDAKLSRLLEAWPGDLNNSSNIFIKSNTIEDAEYNLLCQFYKTANGVVNNKFAVFGELSNEDFGNWSKKYSHWSDMQKWELREWFSIYYSDYVTEWIDIEKDINQVDNFLVINNIDILNNLDIEFTKIVNYCGLTEDKSNEYYDFIINWTETQQYIFKEFELIDKIVSTTTNNLDFDWKNNRLCIVSECIIQKRLRDNGYEIKCYNLNDFPTNSKQLYNLLEKQ